MGDNVRLDPLTEEVITNIEGAQSFSIDVNAASFRVLSDTLYSDKIGAIIRELSCNAWDSHVAAGTTNQKVEISLPNALIPEFIIRDFGTGLSHEDVMELYSTYFRSTKSKSNLFTGALGLGSKSPFCYTDNFMVESFFNGEHSIYQVYLSEDMPYILFLNKNNTEEPNGIKISFSVPVKDHQKFVDSAHDQLFLFGDKTTHTCRSRKYENFTKENIFIENEDIILSNIINQSYSYSQQQPKLFAAMGNVIYNIDTDIIKTSNDFNGLYIILKFELGEIDFAANRESLSYKTKTIDAINNKLQKVLKAMNTYGETLKTSIESLTPTDQIRKCLEIHQKTGKSKNILSKIFKQKSYPVPDVIFFFNKILQEYTKQIGLRSLQFNYKNNWRKDRISMFSGDILVDLLNFMNEKDNNVHGFIANSFDKDKLKHNGLYGNTKVIYGSKEQWEEACRILEIEIDLNDLEISTTKTRHIPEPRSWKEYDVFIKGTKEVRRVILKEVNSIIYNDEDYCPTQWMNVISKLIDNDKIPFIHYTDRIRSILECSFRTLHNATSTYNDKNKEFLKSLQDNIVNMRLSDALYCRRYLEIEINFIKNILPDSQFIKEIEALPLYNFISDADDLKNRIISIVSIKYEAPKFLNNYPMLKFITAKERSDVHPSKDTLIDYIRMCEGERNEVDHYDLICNTARRRNREQSKLRKNEQRGNQSLSSDQQEQCEVSENINQEVLV